MIAILKMKGWSKTRFQPQVDCLSINSGPKTRVLILNQLPYCHWLFYERSLQREKTHNTTCKTLHFSFIYRIYVPLIPKWEFGLQSPGNSCVSEDSTQCNMGESNSIDFLTSQGLGWPPVNYKTMCIYSYKTTFFNTPIISNSLPVIGLLFHQPEPENEATALSLPLQQQKIAGLSCSLL